MKSKPPASQQDGSRILFFTLLWLLFLQLVSDFVETIYTFGLLGVEIPPEVAAVLLFFSPLLLLAVKRGLPARAVPVLAGLAAVLRAAALFLNPTGKLLAAGLGTGCLFLLLPVLFSRPSNPQADEQAAEMGAGLAAGLALSILLRALSAGSDLTLRFPWLALLLAGGMLALCARLWRVSPPSSGPAAAGQAGFGAAVLPALGLTSALSVIYFAYASPAAAARWLDVDFRLVLLFLGAGLALAFAGFAAGPRRAFSPTVLLGANLLWIAAGVGAVLSGQVSFPADSAAYPIEQPAVGLGGQALLYLFLLLAPVVLLNFTLAARELLSRRPAPRAVAGAFGLAAFFFLLVFLFQAFTTVYDYIPVVGPLFRDRFWLTLLIPMLGAALPGLTFSRPVLPAGGRVLRAVFFPAVLAALMAAVLAGVLSARVDAAQGPAESLRVLTYNIQQGYDAGGVRAYELQLKTIRSLNPDIIGLQESDLARFSGGNADIVRTFAQGLKMHSYYGPRTVTGTFGIALLSRYPIENPRTFFMYSLGEQTAAIEAAITVGQTRYRVLVTHLGNGGPIIQQQQVLSQLQSQEPVIIMGDFNFRPNTEQYRLTLTQLQDAWVKAGSAGDEPDKRIDHMFVSPDVTVRSAGYIRSPASDHPALLVEIQP